MTHGIIMDNKALSADELWIAPTGKLDLLRGTK